MRHFSRQSPCAKGICGVLCCLLLGGCISFGGLAYQLQYHYGSSGNAEDIAGSTAANSAAEQAWNLFTLEQNQKHLTYLGKQDDKKLSDALEPANTNFRYRILTMNGKTLLDNLNGTAISQQVTEVYDSVYTVGDSLYTEYDENVSSMDEQGQYTTQGTITYDQNYIRAKSETISVTEDSGPTSYVLEWGIAKELTAQDDLLDFQQNASRYSVRVLPLTLAAVACGVLCLAACGWLLVLIGHKRGVSGIYLTRLHRCPYDLLVVLEVILCSLYLSCAVDALRTLFAPFSLQNGSLPFFATLTGLAALGSALGLPLYTTLVAQLKDHSWLRRTLLFQIGSRVAALLHQIPTNGRAFFTTCVFLLGYALLTFWSGYNHSYLALFLAVLLAVGTLLVLLWWLKGWSSIWKGGKALAEGDLNHVTDTEHLPWDLKQHGENLNAISKGMQKAVDQRIRSDRFRTELITNVSHDLKTPLTSIINYVDLLKKLQLEDEAAQRYLEVLDRKSQRLKTLTEDLVEASKASTGVLPVNLQRMDACQLVEQALAEYSERLTAAGLSIVTQYPPDGAWIRADGRHLWRILDNLLSNCAKYAMPGTRVYVDVLRTEGTITLAVKNISADPLNVPAQELLQRFVRGDVARTSEGSGLGLSIAQSLANLQGAKFRLQVDGDLFKATICFPEDLQGPPKLS